VIFINLITFAGRGKRGKVNKNSPSKIEGVPVRGRECALSSKIKDRQTPPSLAMLVPPPLT
jgi:hypothetical protein